MENINIEKVLSLEQDWKGFESIRNGESTDVKSGTLVRSFIHAPIVYILLEFYLIMIKLSA